MKDTERLTKKQQQYVQLLASGMESRAAARSAGYSESFSRVAAHRLGKKPAVARYLASIQAEARSVAVYGVVEAMAQAQKGIDLAERHKNPMAFIKGCELRAKLSGLLIDRTEVVVVDLKGSLEQAKLRVININSPALPSNGGVGPATDLAVSGAAYRGPGTQGDPIGD